MHAPPTPKPYVTFLDADLQSFPYSTPAQTTLRYPISSAIIGCEVGFINDKRWRAYLSKSKKRKRDQIVKNVVDYPVQVIVSMDWPHVTRYKLLVSAQLQCHESLRIFTQHILMHGLILANLISGAIEDRIGHENGRKPGEVDSRGLVRGFRVAAQAA
ncbi:hypothetical protein L6452_44035 [Arctium lappa]|uniref:Uncharacterized protein n=1 Tax=Arctium lappa TaxID=4217 RepID=A0ACB8XFA0_ARCLA|nr:hypothetical protein L6452_44035 [Arctium lappa]